MKIETKITEAVKAIVEELYGQAVPDKMVQLQQTRPEFEGQITLVVFPFTKMSHKAPDATAQEIGAGLMERLPEVVSKFNAVKGFLNLSISSRQWIELLQDIYENPKFGFLPVTDDSPLVMIEYSSPNTNKPLHLGHVRNNLLGWALAQVMEANGNKVVKTNIVNDRGIHICKSMLAWLKWGNGETPESSGKKGDHLIGDYYVAFDKHYREEVKELVAKAGHGRGAGEAGGSPHQGGPRDARQVGAERPRSAQPLETHERMGLCRFRRDLQGAGRLFR